MTDKTDSADDITQEDIRRYATHLSHQRRQDIPGECVVCGKPFVGTRKRRFCSHACAQRDYYARHKRIPDESDT